MKCLFYYDTVGGERTQFRTHATGHCKACVTSLPCPTLIGASASSFRQVLSACCILWRCILLLTDILGSFQSLPRVVKLWPVGDKVSPGVDQGQGASVMESRRRHFYVFRQTFSECCSFLSKGIPSLLYIRFCVKGFVQVKFLKITLLKIQNWVCYFKEPSH